MRPSPRLALRWPIERGCIADFDAMEQIWHRLAQGDGVCLHSNTALYISLQVILHTEHTGRRENDPNVCTQAPLLLQRAPGGAGGARGAGQGLRSQAAHLGPPLTIGSTVRPAAAPRVAPIFRRLAIR